MLSDLEIAQNTAMKPIEEVAAELGIPAAALECYGRYKAKIALDFIRFAPPAGAEGAGEAEAAPEIAAEGEAAAETTTAACREADNVGLSIAASNLFNQQTNNQDKTNSAVAAAEITAEHHKIGHALPAAAIRPLPNRKTNSQAKLVLVSAISPTPAGEGKTTLTIGLAQALCRLGHKTAVALREPSQGPVMGRKGGATGGGYAQILPMEDINLHFTGDMHAISSTHNLLAALLDNHLQQGNALNIDARRIVWPRALDINDRALRHITLGLGGPANGVPREGGFIITVASEIMAILCLSRDYADMTARLGRIIVAYTVEGRPVRAADLKAEGAMSALLREALKPNLAQTLEQTPCFVHGGPFANIAHGCNSILATQLALQTADYALTEAGFGADLGAEKFLDIVCPQAGFKPAAAALVATIRALKYNGGAALADLKREDLAALEKGSANLGRHIRNLQKFGLPVLAVLNHFEGDTAAERAWLAEYCAGLGIEMAVAEVHGRGGAGGEAVATALLRLLEREESRYQPLYATEMPLKEKIARIAGQIYGAAAVRYSAAAEKALAEYQAAGYGNLPVCIAKTQYSFSDDPKLLGAPEGFTMTVRAAELRAGAGFVVIYMGDILAMPGLPRHPAAEHIALTPEGQITGLS